MATPKRRRIERASTITTNKGNTIVVPPINPDTRTARALAADPRVKSLDFDTAPGKVVVTLSDRWHWQFSAGQVLTFDLWEQARNAVRRAVGPSIRDLKAEAATGHLDADAC